MTGLRSLYVCVKFEPTAVGGGGVGVDPNADNRTEEAEWRCSLNDQSNTEVQMRRGFEPGC